MSRLYEMYPDYGQDEEDFVKAANTMMEKGIPLTALEFVPEQYRGLGTYPTAASGVELEV